MRFLGSIQSLAAVMALVLLLAGCKKPSADDKLSATEERDIAQSTARNDVQAYFSFDDAFDNALGVNSELGIGGTGVFFRPNPGDSLPPCVSVTITRLALPQPFPVRVVVDFGSTGCTGRDGRTRRGRIITEYFGRLAEPGGRAVTAFDNFFIDSLKIEGTQSIQNVGNGPTPGAPPPPRQFRIDVQNARITGPGGIVLQWQGERRIQQIEGMGTPHPIDDVLHVTGSARGTLRSSSLITTWESQIEAPLRKRFNCRWFTAGKVVTRRGGLPGSSPWIARLDYGAGTCDNQALLSINNFSYQVLLP